MAWLDINLRREVVIGQKSQREEVIPKITDYTVKYAWLHSQRDGVIALKLVYIIPLIWEN